MLEVTRHHTLYHYSAWIYSWVTLHIIFQRSARTKIRYIRQNTTNNHELPASKKYYLSGCNVLHILNKQYRLLWVFWFSALMRSCSSAAVQAACLATCAFILKRESGYDDRRASVMMSSLFLHVITRLPFKTTLTLVIVRAAEKSIVQKYT